MAEERLNVLFIQTDQWPQGFMGYAGCGQVMTPTIDQLARDGIVYSNCYSTCPVCIPARRSLMTGMTPKSHGDRVYSARMTMPKAVTLAQAFSDAGYQTVAVGKLHVYPQRSRIGFDEVILQEEGRYEFGVLDDYQIWLGEQGAVGQEFAHAMGNNTYYTNPWPLKRNMHPTVWATAQMVRQIQRRDPTRPSFFYLSYQFPHPPLVPLKEYMDMYRDEDICSPVAGDWVDESFIMKEMTESARHYSPREILLARRAYFAQCTLIDHQLRLVLGALRENGLLSSTLIVFASDHGEMLFDHRMAGKRSFYENSAHIPLLFSGQPAAGMRGSRDHRLACLEDVMPTLLVKCGIPVPDTVEGMDLFGEERRSFLFGEISDGPRATRMLHDGRYKLIYYPWGNRSQLFDIEKDPQEMRDLAGNKDLEPVLKKLQSRLMECLYGEDRSWIQAGELRGVRAPEYTEKADYGFSNQRGLHWPVTAPPAR